MFERIVVSVDGSPDSNRAVEVAGREESADLIVLGSRGMSRIQEIMIGSVANKVIHLSPYPVLLAR